MHRSTIPCHQASLFSKFLGAGCVLFAWTLAARADAQVLTIVDAQGNQITDGSVVYIQPNGSRFGQENPKIDDVTLKYENHGSACGTIQYNITEIHWQNTNRPTVIQTTYYTYQAAGNGKYKYVKTGTGSPTPTNPNYFQTLSVSPISGTLGCGDTVTLGWDGLDAFYGGGVHLSWSWSGNDGGYTSGKVDFKILGNNPAVSDLQGALSGLPWYYPLILKGESRLHQFEGSQYPLAVPNPEGIGIGQFDPHKSSSSHSIGNKVPGDVRTVTSIPQYAPPDMFWNWQYNLQQSENKLAGFITSGQTYWTKQVNNMRATESLVPGSSDQWPTASQGQQFGSSCNFTNAYPPSFGDYGWDSAFAIENYNKGSAPYTIVWAASANPVPGNLGSWVLGDTSYLTHICTQTFP